VAQDVTHEDADAIKAGQLVQDTATKITGHVDDFRDEADLLVTSRGFEGDAAVKFLHETDTLADVHAKRLIRRIELAIEKLNKTDEVLQNVNATIAGDTKSITINYG